MGSVATISLDTTITEGRNSERCAIHAFAAMTTLSAVMVPAAVCTSRPSGPGAMRLTGERSYTSAPRASAVWRRPRAKSAGCTRDARSSITPAR